jgi:hypothetical protein|tara:strand:- start:433 stop:618 length:186 start_codon:yes stop_codon:yes gene_type:complete
MPNPNEALQEYQTDAADAAAALVVLLARAAAREFVDASEQCASKETPSDDQSSSNSICTKE